FTEEITDFYVKDDPTNVIERNSEIIRWMYERGIALDDGTIVHNYPHCWRCKHPLIYKAMDAWYFNIEAIKDKLRQANEDIHWVPEHIKYGRFGNWLEGARDWNISRNRYWSTPMPIWECDCCDHRVVLGSAAEIYEKSGIKLDNLHRQYMDTVTFPCECGGVMHRIPEVLDCWFESGSVPFAQKHYPFENKEWFETHFPSDFIVEYTGQIRCWFYYLHVLSVALFDKPAYKNCLVHGTVLAKDGKKLSKSSKNYTDPMELMKGYGTDAFRLYLYQTNAMLVGDLLFDETGIKDALQQFIFPLWNAHSFFVSYANIDHYHPSEVVEPQAENLLDSWILAKLYDTGNRITQQMDVYQIDRYMEPLASLLDALTNWYIRRSRRRFWEEGLSGDKKSAYDTLYYVLVNICKLLAPVAPIISEKLYKNLTGEVSVHLAAWPTLPKQYDAPELLEQMELVRDVVSLARSIRNKNQVKNRQPLQELRIALPKTTQRQVVLDFSDVIAEELNVKEVSLVDRVEDIATLKYAPNFAFIREKYANQTGEIIRAIKSGQFELNDNEAILTMNAQKKNFDKEVILVEYEPKEGLFIASGNGMVLSLDLSITQELIDEGLAREIIRNIQDARKQVGYAIMDRIGIEFDGQVPAEWTTHICNETLATLCSVETPDIAISVTGNKNDTISIKIKQI
ncbi:MAG: class I tRNA ligase family protein, partial [Lachnospiraceae bacterium]|nr:class I tRNA ligase family protein [Lachnospiraceae bacterium]